ncbi:filamin-A-interacting protein 1-like protein [Lates japonicus]|uniref:Filamin-A-interacting protein 1-like protein n=1 Tax=Lates japonicus TaxID=270547 RepID=A0AAD3MAH4_LATJO|nr:filamin-A-interacting protein 1-like protein [Lates japonicus]
MSDYQEQIQRLRAAPQQKMELEIKLLQQDASEREKSFCKKLDDLKIKLLKQMLLTHGGSRSANRLRRRSPFLLYRNLNSWRKPKVQRRRLWRKKGFSLENNPPLRKKKQEKWGNQSTTI